MTSEILTPNKNYNKIRTFLRLLFLKGCYSKKTFKKYGLLSDKQYRNYTGILREYFNEDYHNIEQYSRDSLQLNFEYYETTENYLVDSYLTKSSTSNYMSVYFLLLQILNIEKVPLRRNEISERLYAIYGYDEDTNRKDCKDISEASIYNYLKEFVKLDILKENEDNEFYISHDIFKDLSNEELINLYDCVSFFSNVLYPSTPGYYLKESLKNYGKYIRNMKLEEQNIFLHRFIPLHSVLDDGIVIECLGAIKDNKRIQVNYEKLTFDDSYYRESKNEMKISPIKLIFDFSLGRWYLAYLDDEDRLSMLRLDRMQNVKLLGEKFHHEAYEEYFHREFKDVWTASMPFGDNEDKEICLQIPKEGKYTLKRLIREGHGGQLTLGQDDNYYFNISVKDDVELLPWIRTLSPYVKIIGNEDLKDRFIDDLMEMKNSYGII